MLAFGRAKVKLFADSLRRAKDPYINIICASRKYWGNEHGKLIFSVGCRYLLSCLQQQWSTDTDAILEAAADSNFW